MRGRPLSLDANLDDPDQEVSAPAGAARAEDGLDELSPEVLRQPLRVRKVAAETDHLETRLREGGIGPIPRYTVAAGWLLLAPAIYFVAKAQPVSSYDFFDRLGSGARRYWDWEALGWAALFVGAAWLFATAGLVAQALRDSENPDADPQMRNRLLVLGVVSTVGLAGLALAYTGQL